MLYTPLTESSLPVDVVLIPGIHFVLVVPICEGRIRLSADWNNSNTSSLVSSTTHPLTSFFGFGLTLKASGFCP